MKSEIEKGIALRRVLDLDIFSVFSLLGGLALFLFGMKLMGDAIGRQEAHAELARALDFPEYYGANLDALYDLTSTMEAELTLIHPAPMLDALQIYGCKLLQTLYEAAECNPDFRFHVKEEQA